MEYELYHYGVLGMKWGIRKARKNGIQYTYKSHGQKKWEKKLAKERQKGKDTSKAERKLAAYKTRDSRRQIKAVVKQRSKDPTYKKAYDEYLSKQDMASHAVKARRERKIEDFKIGAKETVSGVANTLMGNPGRAAGTVAFMTTAALAAHKYGIDKMILQKAKMAFNDARQFVQNRDLRLKVEKILNSKR